MRVRAAIILGRWTAAGAWAQSPLAAEIRARATRYHEDPARIDTLRAAVTQAAPSDPHVDNLLALAQIASLYGDEGLEVDARFTGLRIGLARTLIKRGRIAEARARLDSLPGHS
jgi:hypothetical protein